MPLILMCGHPCSGKSTVVQLIAELMRNCLPNAEVLTVAEQLPTWFKDSGGDCPDDSRSRIYADSYRERDVRGQHKSEIEHALSGTSSQTMRIVIMDAPNYIKGYRYELYCLAKSLKHQHAVIWCDTPAAKCFEWNNKIGHYSKKCLTEMITRFESPQSSCRWDNPLLSIHPDHFFSAGEVDCTQIVDQLVQIFTDKSKTDVRPNKSTHLSHVAPTNFLQELERSIQSLVSHILTCQSMGASFADLPTRIRDQLPVDSELSSSRLALNCGGSVYTLANLGRKKRQFIHAQASKLSDPQFTQNPMNNCATVAVGFLTYLRMTYDCC